MHPDVSTDDGATTDAVALNAAYTALMVSIAFLVPECKQVHGYALAFACSASLLHLPSAGHLWLSCWMYVLDM